MAPRRRLPRIPGTAASLLQQVLGASREPVPGLRGEGDSAPPSRFSQGPRATPAPWRRARERAVSSCPGGSSESKLSKAAGHSLPSGRLAPASLPRDQAGPSSQAEERLDSDPGLLRAGSGPRATEPRAPPPAETLLPTEAAAFTFSIK